MTTLSPWTILISLLLVACWCGLIWSAAVVGLLWVGLVVGLETLSGKNRLVKVVAGRCKLGVVWI